MIPAITIQPIYTLTKMAEVEPIEKEIWGIADIEVTCTHTLHSLVENGGSLIGAYDDDKLIGFVLGIPALIQDESLSLTERIKMYSYMAGVLPTYQGQGIGFRLKLAQREDALQQGYRLITWTYDPLESLNAHLNLGKLGAICRMYCRHFHGDLGGINAGLPTDRFDVEWWLDKESVQQKTAGKKRPLSLSSLIAQDTIILNPTTTNLAGFPIPPEATAPLTAPSLIEIPSYIRAIKEQDPTLAEMWRFHTRQLFETAFAQGFAITDFVFDKDENGRFHSYYLLTIDH